MARSVSESVPIWFALISTALINPRDAASSIVLSFVVTRSSPITRIRSPRPSSSFRQPSWSSSEKPSSIERIGTSYSRMAFS